jgi:hypothetical protein
MAYQIRGRLSTGAPFTTSAEGLGEANEAAKKAVRDGNCQRVDIFDPAVSNTNPIVTHEQIQAAADAEGDEGERK